MAQLSAANATVPSILPPRSTRAAPAVAALWLKTRSPISPIRRPTSPFTIMRAMSPMRRTGCAAPAMSPRRSPGLPVSIKDLFDVAGEQHAGRLDGAATMLAGRRATRRSSRGSRRRRGAGRPHQHDRIRLLGRRHQPALRHARQSRTTAALIPGGSSSGAAVSVATARRRRDRHRHRRLGAHPGGAVRPRRLQADADARAARRRAAAVDDARFDRTARQQHRLLRHRRRGHGRRGRRSCRRRCRSPGCGSRCRRARRSTAATAEVTDAFAGACAGAVAGRRAARRSAVRRVRRICRRSTPTGGFAAAEASTWHRALIARRGDDYDPRVRGRIERGRRP